VVTHQNPDDSHSVVGTVGLGLPVHVSEGVLEESSNVFECSPSLGLISRFLLGINELGEVTVGFFCEGSNNYKKG
jgi:hypothetical protein